jgi:hypothetical protein
VQGKAISDELLHAFNVALPSISNRYTDSARIISGAPAMESGYSPAEHWAAIHSFIQQVLAGLRAMVQHALVAESFASKMVDLVQAGHSALQSARCSPIPTAIVATTTVVSATAAAWCHIPYGTYLGQNSDSLRNVQGCRFLVAWSIINLSSI